MEEADYIFKIIVIGNSGVGKSSIVYRFINGEGKLKKFKENRAKEAKLHNRS
jgi:GTPase SAR1 family protein